MLVSAYKGSGWADSISGIIVGSVNVGAGDTISGSTAGGSAAAVVLTPGSDVVAVVVLGSQVEFGAIGVVAPGGLLGSNAVDTCRVVVSDLFCNVFE